LIVFKIKPEKTIEDLLNLPNKIDQINEIISINRENKINFLNYIYRTNDNYIIASSDKKLIKNSINSSNDFKEKKFLYEGELFGLNSAKKYIFAQKKILNHPTVILQPFIQKIFINFLFVQSLFKQLGLN